MAGGKESPRQKMISMMYLVLTALLALNVSNSVLDKFLLIDKSLEVAISEKNATNAGVIGRIESSVEESGNRPKDVAVLEKASVLREQTNAILRNLDQYRAEFIERTGGLDQDGSYKGLQDIDAVPLIMITEAKGEVLKTDLNAYSTFLRETTGNEKFHDLALDAKDMQIFKNDENQKRKGFAELNFGNNTPMVGALATISQLKTEVLNAEGVALENLALKVGAGDIKFDRIIAMVRPESQTVAAGASYKADMFIAASASGITPTMTVNGTSIEVVDGTGSVQFVARATSFDKNGLSEQSYEASITVPRPGGGDTTFVNTQTYFVAKPVIQIQSASVQALFLNCGNELDVQVPSLGSSYDPRFNIKGGQLFTGQKRGNITIVPSAANVSLSVTNGGNFIGKQDFKVKRIPKPEIVIYAGRNPVDIARGLSTPPRSLQVRAQPDESFQQFLPKDARFRVNRTVITLVRGGRAVQSVRVNGPKANLSALAAQARSGDDLVVEVQQVLRRNFRDKTEEFNNYGPRVIRLHIN